MDIIQDIQNIFKNNCTYKKIKEECGIQLRNKKDGIALNDALLYRFLYTDIATTKQNIVSFLNDANKTTFTRQAYNSKEDNIPIKFYELLLKEFTLLHNKYCQSDATKLIAVDGTYNNDNKHNIMLNLGLFDVTNHIPVDISYYGPEYRNMEVQAFIEYIKENVNDFDNVVFIADRGYFNYDLLDFLITKKLKFIIRGKGSADNLDSTVIVYKNTKKYDIINKIKSKLRIVKCKNVYNKIVTMKNDKDELIEREIEISDDYVLITNLMNKKKYSDNKILDYYHLRWDIEVFYKFVKKNFKFQNIKEKQYISFQKSYICELILVYLMKLIEHYYFNNKECNKMNIYKEADTEYIIKINESNLMNGVFRSLLYNIFNNNFDKSKIDNFCNSYIVLVKNKKNRSFPRISKQPYSKWQIKGHTVATKYVKIIEAIENNTVNELHKNLKTLAKKIKLIR